MDRRHYLKYVAIAGGAGALAGCMDDGGNGNGDDDTPTETATDTTGDEDTPSETDDMGEPTDTPPTDPDQRVAVGDGTSFNPSSFDIAVGDTVLWDWVDENLGHNIKYDDGDVPDGTDWNGTAGSRTTTYGEGHRHWFTFETAGEYNYYCVPHRSSGMTGSFTVTE